ANAWSPCSRCSRLAPPPRTPPLLSAALLSAAFFAAFGTPNCATLPPSTPRLPRTPLGSFHSSRTARPLLPLPLVTSAVLVLLAACSLLYFLRSSSHFIPFTFPCHHGTNTRLRTRRQSQRGMVIVAAAKS